MTCCSGRAYIEVNNYHLRNAGVREQDIPPIREALKKLQPKYQHVYQPVGAITYWGNEPTDDILMCYQSAAILVDVPCLCSGSRSTTRHNTIHPGQCAQNLQKLSSGTNLQIGIITSDTRPYYYFALLGCCEIFG